MEWLNNLTGGENGSAINLIIITLAIFLLVLIIGWIFRKLSGSAAKKAMRSRVPRLSITDTTKIDEKRWLVMVRRDNIEHLLLIGGSNDVVVETNIVRAKVPQSPTLATQQNTQAIAQSKENSSPEVANTTPTIEEVAKPEQKSSITAPVAGVAALGAAGLSSVKAAASDVTETVTETASKATESVGSAISATSDAVTETADNAVSAVGETVSKGTEAITETATNTVETVSETVSSETPEVSEASNEVADIDLESQISAQLDGALADEELSIDTAELTEAAEEQEAPASNEDDEMQRLLDELSSEMKEPA